MKKVFLFALISLMTLGAMAEEKAPEKGPAVLETENFSVKVPKGWVIKKFSSGYTSSVELVPEKKPTPATNFGYSIEIWSFRYSGSTVEKQIDQALRQYGEGATKKLEDVKIGENTYQHTYFDEGHGSSQHLVTALKESGVMNISLHSYSLDNKDVKNIIKSIKLKK